MPSKNCMAQISGEVRSVLKRVVQTQRLVPADASEVASKAEALQRQAEEVVRANAEANVAASDSPLGGNGELPHHFPSRCYKQLLNGHRSSHTIPRGIETAVSLNRKDRGCSDYSM